LLAFGGLLACTGLLACADLLDSNLYHGTRCGPTSAPAPCRSTAANAAASASTAGRTCLGALALRSNLYHGTLPADDPELLAAPSLAADRVGCSARRAGRAADLAAGGGGDCGPDPTTGLVAATGGGTEATGGAPAAGGAGGTAARGPPVEGPTAEGAVGGAIAEAGAGGGGGAAATGGAGGGGEAAGTGGAPGAAA
jgi:hypothetical protein